MRPTALSLLAALACGGCGADGAAVSPAFAPGSSVPVAVEVTPVPLDPTDASRQAIGAFVFAGGIEIRAPNQDRFRELSDLRIIDDRVIAVTDQGDVFRARLTFHEGRLTGLADGRLERLTDEQGQPLRDGAESDAEGLAIFPNGDWLVSFERNHRIWRYPGGSGVPQRAPTPEFEVSPNAGLEALTAYPSAGADAYLAGTEGGMVWLCRLGGACSDAGLASLVPEGLGLTALAAYGSNGSLALLGRAYDPGQGTRIALRLIAPDGTGGYTVLDEMRLGPPLTRDNFEGLAAVPLPDGRLRIYLLSDDNASRSQHTYLFAFDWRR